jgi:integrase
MATGVRQRHGRACNAKGRCKCPYEAFVYSRRDGKKIRKAFPTYGAARAWREDANKAVRERKLRAPTTITLEQAATAWLDGAREGLIRPRSGTPYKPSAIRTYEGALRRRVLPRLGQVRLTELTRTDLQDLVDELAATGFNASTINVTLLPVRAVCRRALSRGEVAINPTSGLEMPAVRGGRDRIAPPEECVRLLSALRRADRVVWATAMYAGLRRGELMALRVEDIDLGAGVIHVRRGWDAEAGEIPTKSGRDRRVPIAGVLRDYLDEHLLGLAWDKGLVFGVSAVSPFCDRTLAERAARAWKRAQLTGITLHECRPYLRLPDDRGGREREGAEHLHGPCLDLDHARPLRPPHARQRGRGGGTAGQLAGARRQHRSNGTGGDLAASPGGRDTAHIMTEESTTPDLEERWRRAVEAFARGNSDEAAAAYAGRAVFDLSRLGIGIFEGREAIRGLFADWVEPYEEYQAECEEFRDLGNGVSFAVLLHGGRPRGSDGFVDVRHSYTMTWRHGLIERFTVYADIDEARAAAERLAEERG